MFELSASTLELIDNPILSEMALVLCVVVIGIVAVRLIQAGVVRSVDDNSTRYRIRKFAGLGGYVVLGLIIASLLSDRLGEMSVILGVAGAGIAFSLQEVIASLAGWIGISFGSFYRSGDRVQVGGIVGDVIDIGMLRTTLMETGGWVSGDLYNGRIVRVANSFVFKEPVYNYTDDFSFLWDELLIPVRHGSDWKLAVTLIEDAVRQTVVELTDQEEAWSEMLEKYRIEPISLDPVVTVLANENWIEFTARYVVNYRARRSTKDRITRKLLDKIAETDGQVVLGRTTLELVSNPSVESRRNPKEVKLK